MTHHLNKHSFFKIATILIGCSHINSLQAVVNPFLPDDDNCSDEIIENDLPSGYSAANIWYQVMTKNSSHNQATDGEAIIQIAYDKVIEQCDNSTKTIYERNYTNYKIAPTNQYGALYLRDPWFGGNNFNEELSNTYVQNNALTISVGGTPDRVAHWWTDRFNVSSSCKYISEISFKITGAATFQVGSDWWRSTSAPYSGWDAACITSNNCEAWLSDWFSDTNGEFITIKVPYHDKCKTALYNAQTEAVIIPSVKVGDKDYRVKLSAPYYITEIKENLPN